MAQKHRQERQRPRAELRQHARVVRKAGDRLQRLGAELPGGSPERPFSVATAAVIIAKVRALRCLRCDGELDVGEESAESVNHQLLRRFELSCRRCRVPRVAWFRIVPMLPS